MPGPLRSPTPPGLASRPGTHAWWTDALVGSSWIGRRCLGLGSHHANRIVPYWYFHHSFWETFSEPGASTLGSLPIWRHQSEIAKEVRCSTINPCSFTRKKAASRSLYDRFVGSITPASNASPDSAEPPGSHAEAGRRSLSLAPKATPLDGHTIA